MELYYKKATPADLDVLVRARVEVLCAANGLPEGTPMLEVEAQSRTYYQRALTDGSHTAYLVYQGENVVGAGGISYYQVMPTYHNPSGWKAYIMNMYTAPSCRRSGIATKTLQLLVDDAKSRNVQMITLEATAMGRPLYQKFGFIPMNDEMILPADNVN